MEALENIKNIKIYDTTFEHLTEVMDSYKKYMTFLDELSLKELAIILQTLRKE